MRVLYRYITALAALAAMIPGCAQLVGDRTLTVVHRGWPLTLAPHLKAEVVTVSVQSNIYEALVALSPEMEIRPSLAEGWECPNDTTWIFRIRPGIKFHDGTELTARDVAYSLERARSHPGSVLKGNFSDVRSIEAFDRSAVRMATTRSCPALPNKLINVFIIPAGAAERLGEQRFARAPVGTGPYRLASFPEGGPLVLDRWEGYWAERPEVRRLVVWSQWKLGPALAMLAAGEADIVTQVDADSARGLAQAAPARYRIISRPGLLMRYLGFDCRSRPFRDRRVRRAVALAVDRREIVDSAYAGFGAPASQLVTSGVFGFNPELPPLAYDPAEARRLLREAGYPGGIDLVLTLPDARLGLGALLAKQMKAAGIRLELLAWSREEFFRAVDTAGFFLMGASSLSADAADLMDDAIHSRTGGYGQTNRGGYRNRRMDLMIEKASLLTDQVQRRQALQEIMALAMDDMPRAPLVVGDDVYGVSARIDWRPRADLMLLAKEVRFAKAPADIR
jgi:peptide/nickel transport system substrate-binding protein